MLQQQTASNNLKLYTEIFRCRMLWDCPILQRFETSNFKFHYVLFKLRLDVQCFIQIVLSIPVVPDFLS